MLTMLRWNAVYMVITTAAAAVGIIIVAAAIASTAAASPSESATGPPSLVPETVLRLIRTALDCRRAPGLSLSVVHRGRVVLAGGFGWADVERGVAANESTAFFVGSITKTFTATLLGMLLNDGRYEKMWDTLVVDIIGSEFRFADSRHRWATVRDILAHRVGLAPYVLPLMLGPNSHRSDRELCRRFQFMNTSGSFRDRFQYNNLMYVLAGCLVEALGNDSYEALLTDRILRPLRMNDTRLIRKDDDDDDLLRRNARLAKMYFVDDFDERLYPLDMESLRCLESLLAAGGMVSTANDMTKWMRFLLSRGQDDSGRELIPWRILAQMFVGQIPFPKTNRSVDLSHLPLLDSDDSYGIGFLLGYYQGYPKQMHTGRIFGYDSRMTLLNSAQLGIFSVSNGPAYLSLETHQLVHYLIADALLNLSSAWLNESTVCTFPRPWVSDFSRRRERPPKPDEAPAAEDARIVESILEKEEFYGGDFLKPGSADRSVNTTERFLQSHRSLYTGSYGHPLFGNFTVAFDRSSSRLRFSYGVLGRGWLAFVDGLTWTMRFDGPMSHLHVARGSNVNASYPIEFRGYDGPRKRFGKLVVKAFERREPPVFVRDLKWADLSSIVGPHVDDAGLPVRVTRVTLIAASVVNLLRLGY